MDNQRMYELRTMDYSKYLQTPEWQEKRQLVLERDDYRCRLCNTDEKLQIHHRTYIRRGCEDLNDLTTLCQDCHENFHENQSQEEIMLQTYSPPAKTKEQHALEWEDLMLGMLLIHPELTAYVCGIINVGDFIDDGTQDLYAFLTSQYQQYAASSVSQPIEQLIPEELQETASRAKQKAAEAKSRPHEEWVKTAIQCATRIKRTRLLQINTELTHQIVAATHAGDKESVSHLSKQLSAVQRELRTIYAATHLQGQ